MLRLALSLACLVNSVAATDRFESTPSAVRAVLDANLTVVIRDADVELSGPTWKGHLATRSLGRVGETTRLETADSSLFPERAEHRWPGLTEWFVRGSEGVEQGWTIAEPPSGARSRPVSIGLEVRGDVSMRIADDGLSAWFVDGRGNLLASYRRLHAFDATGQALSARLTSSSAGIAVEVDDHDATYPITVDPWIGTPFWQVTGTATDQLLGDSLRGAGDVNNDGFSDVIIGGNGFVRVYHGGSSGLGSTPNTTILDPGVSSGFGKAVSTAGDFNGDGYDDVIVGAPYDSALQAQAGKVYVYPGSASGVLTTPIYTYALPAYFPGGHAAWCGWSVTFVGDLDNDGRDEIAFGIPYDNPNAFPIGSPGTVRLVRGGTSTMTTILPPSSTNQGAFGWSIVNAGDTDGDGDIEIFVTALDYANGGAQAGQVFGTRFTGFVPTSLGAVTGIGLEHCGFSLGGGGDINGDGRTDLVAGLPGFASNRGKLIAMNGMPPGGAGGAPFFTASGTATGDRFAESIAIAGDVNGDGFADIVAGLPNYSGTVGAGEGRAVLYFGGAATMSPDPAFTLTGDGFDHHTGSAVAAAGDVNGDGYGDFLVAARDYNDYGSMPVHFHTGRVWLFYGHASAPTYPAWYRNGPQAGALGGSATTFLGDVNGDGYDDVAMNFPLGSSGQAEEGYVDILAGSASGLGTTPLSRVESNVANAHFGRAIAGLGDVDGDGFADVAVGAPDYTNTYTNEGAVFVFRGSATGLLTTPAWVIEGGFPNIHWGSAIASHVDVNGDGFGDLAIGCRDCYSSLGGEGELWVYFGGPLGISTSNPWVVQGGQANAHLGESIASAGDVDGDGFGDLIAGAPDFENGQVGEGVIRVWRGSATGLASTPFVTIEGDFPNIHWGRRVSGLGDVNGDGYSDIVVGCPQCYSTALGQGEAWVYHGSPSGLTLAWTHTGSVADDAYGSSVAAAGDVNGDGFGDLVVGAPYADVVGFNVGAAEIYLGSSSGLASTPAWFMHGNYEYYFGQAVSGVGDVNGDGFADVVIGEHTYITPVGSGRLYLLQGNSLAVGGDARTGIKLAARQRRIDERVVHFGASPYSLSQFLLTMNCSNALGVSSTPAGRSRVKFQHETRERTAAFQPSGYTTTPSWISTGALNPGGVGDVANVTGLQDVRGYKWRVRCQFDDPFFPRTPWTTLSGRCMSEPKLRTPRDCNGNNLPDHVDIAGGALDADHDQLLDACSTIGTPFCFGNAASPACPCGNNVASTTAQVGCSNSMSMGAALTAAGNASIASDTLVLRGSGMPSAPALYFEGTTQQSGGLGVFLGDGKRCAGGTIVRLGTKTNVAGSSSYPVPGDPAIHLRRPITVPGTYTYQVWYRNAAAFCTPSTFNLSNGLQLTWGL